MTTAPLSATPDGRLTDNIIYFGRTLRKAGMRVGPASVRDAIEAVLTTGIGSRDDFYWTLHAVFVKRREDKPVFEEAFKLYWRSRELVEKLIAMFSPVQMDGRQKEKQKAGQTRVSQALFEGQQKRESVENPLIEVDAKFSLSEKEILRTKDFAQMSAEEIRQAKAEIARLRLPFDAVATRRFRPDHQGAQIDPRAMMRQAMRTGGDMVLPRYKARRKVHPPLVILADISGSMSQYSRLFLHFLHALTEERKRVHTFLFGTRLTNISRQMRYRDPDEALALCSGLVKDWSGGTRIGEAFASFNRLWSRRVLGQGAVVLLITDGLERDEVGALAKECERLHKSCRRLVWLNPLLRYEGFEAKAKGVKAILPHVDELRAVHNLNALADLCKSLNLKSDAANNPRRYLERLDGLSAKGNGYGAPNG